MYQAFRHIFASRIGAPFAVALMLAVAPPAAGPAATQTLPAAGAPTAATCEAARLKLADAAGITTELIKFVTGHEYWIKRYDEQRAEVERRIVAIEQTERQWNDILLVASWSIEPLNSEKLGYKAYYRILGALERAKEHEIATRNFFTEQIQLQMKFYATDGKELLALADSLPGLEKAFDEACNEAVAASNPAPPKPALPKPAGPASDDDRSIVLTTAAGDGSWSKRLDNVPVKGSESTRAKQGTTIHASASVDRPLPPDWKLQLSHDGPGGKVDCLTAEQECSAEITLPKDYAGIFVLGQILIYWPKDDPDPQKRGQYKGGFSVQLGVTLDP
jgi:hypothetical protein